jgi:hypothetical protein
MAFWDAVSRWFQDEKRHLVYTRVDPGHVDPAVEPVAMEAGRHYVRWRVAQMFLARSVAWFKEWYPAVHSLVQFDMGNQQVDIPNLADSTKVCMQTSPEGDVIAKNFVLTPAVPFNGGMMRVNAGLMAIEGRNHLQIAIKLLGDLGGLLNVPQFSAALNIAGPLATGIQDIFGMAGNRLHLAVHDAFAAGELHSGYLVAIRATAGQVDAEQLWVVDDELRIGRGPGAGQSEPVSGFDYMLFRAEVFSERDDFEQLTSIQEPYHDALEALLSPDTEAHASQHLRLALLRALKTPELTRADRRRVVESLREQFEQDRQALGVRGLTARQMPSLGQTMRHAMSVDDALARAEPTLGEVLTAG